jgi:hypothetical protein
MIFIEELRFVCLKVWITGASLINIQLNVFKGYREAEIGFIQIEESTTRDGSMSSLSKKSALFLVIHAPKRQLVEV